MASILKVDDLRGNTSAGDITITSEGGSATMQLQQGVAKAWGYLDGTGTIALNDSFNMSSASDEGTAEYGFNFTSNMNNINYCWTAIAGTQAGGSAQMVSPHDPNTTSQVTMENWIWNGTKADRDTNNVTVHGDLA